MTTYPSCRAAIVAVLTPPKGSRKPVVLSTREICERVIGKLWHSTRGLTPDATLSALLATEHAKGTGAFKRTAPGFYTLRSAKEIADAKTAILATREADRIAAEKLAAKTEREAKRKPAAKGKASKGTPPKASKGRPARSSARSAVAA